MLGQTTDIIDYAWPNNRYNRYTKNKPILSLNQKINLINHEPTQSPAVCVVRGAAMQKFGLNPKNRKEPFEWGKVVEFAEAYGVRHQGNIRFVEDGSRYEIAFDKRKNAQLRQGNKVLVASNPSATVCPLRLLRELRIFTGGSKDLFIFRGFNGRLVSKRPGSTAPGPDKITYDQLFRYLGLWFSGLMGVSVAVFRKRFATQFNRSGGASAALNAGVSDEMIGQHGS